MLNGLDLFSGIGGISLALSPWVRPVAYCENNKYAQSVLLSRMRSNELSTAPIWDDVQTLRGNLLGDWVDIVYGGFPCQDISAAGVGKGLDGERSGLFFEVVRIVEETQPAFVFLENVAAIRTRGLSRVVRELARLGFDIRWTTISAASVGAPHLRKRWFLLAAHSDRIGIRELRRWSSRALRKSSTEFIKHGSIKSLADANCLREYKCSKIGNSTRYRVGDSCEIMADSMLRRFEGSRAEPTYGNTRQIYKELGGQWSTEPDVGRVAHGIPARVDRIRGLGNAVVPLQARTAFMRLMGMETVT